MVSPYHSVAAAPAYGGYGGYGGYGVSKVVSPIATLGMYVIYLTEKKPRLNYHTFNQSLQLTKTKVKIQC